MINQVNDIKRFFERLGLKITVEKLASNNPQLRKRHVLEWDESEKIYPERFVPLMSVYFDDVRPTGFAECSVMLNSFSPDGAHGIGICKRCGCSETDACEDPETTTCWWVKDDVCSACATPEEKAAAMINMKEKFKSEER